MFVDVALCQRYLFYAIVLALLPGAPAAGTQPHEDACTGGQVDLEITDAQGTVQRIVGMSAGFGRRLPHSQGATYNLAVVSGSGDACQPLAQTFSQGTAVLVLRGGCDFVTKAEHAAASNASLMLLQDNQPGSCVVMGHNSTKDALKHLSGLYAASISSDAGAQLSSMCPGPESHSAPCEVKAVLRRAPVFDAASLALWAIAVATVVAGAGLAGSDYQHMIRLPVSREEDDLLPHGKRAFEDNHRVFLTAGAAVGFVFVASALLMMMFFFLNEAFYWTLVVLYCMGAIQAMTYLFSSALGSVTAHGFAARLCHCYVELPGCGKVSMATGTSFVAAVCIAVVWCFNQLSPWAWVAQNIMGVCLMLCILRFVRLPDLRVGTLLLSLAFVYDVFWVFIQPRLFGGTSVMATVAEGGHSRHMLPMLLMVPHKLGTLKSGLAILGFGDVVLPGQLVTFMRIVDIELGFASTAARIRHGYFLPAVVAYGFGLLLTYAALYFEVGGSEGQPALLYLVPCTLGVVVGLAVLRGHLRLLWGEGGRAGHVQEGDAARPLSLSIGGKLNDSDEALRGRLLNGTGARGDSA